MSVLCNVKTKSINYTFFNLFISAYIFKTIRVTCKYDFELNYNYFCVYFISKYIFIYLSHR